MKIKIIELKEIIDNIIERLKDVFGDEIIIENEDYYWVIPEDEIFNPYEKPKLDSLGQITDDWEDLRRLIDKKDIPLSNDLILLGSILQAIRKNCKGKC
jgi:hypothetical protein